MLRESAIKAGLIDWFFQKNLLNDDAVLINELPVDDFSRRADIVIANGKLLAFEIKSDYDNLERLEGQIETYLDYFDKVTLVCAAKFTSTALRKLPREVEILEYKESDDKLNFVSRNRGRQKLVTSNEKFLSFVDKRSLIRGLRRKKIACNESFHREQLYEVSQRLNKSTMRLISLDYLKNKYARTYNRFLLERKDITQTSDLKLLSKRKLNSSEPQGDVKKLVSNSLEAYSSKISTKDITENLMKYGFSGNQKVKITPRIATSYQSSESSSSSKL